MMQQHPDCLGPQTEPSLEWQLAHLLNTTPGSIERQVGLTDLILAIQLSGEIWLDPRCVKDCYGEALQRTWLHFCGNLDGYLAGGVMQSFNAQLKREMDGSH